MPKIVAISLILLASTSSFAWTNSIQLGNNTSTYDSDNGFSNSIRIGNNTSTYNLNSTQDNSDYNQRRESNLPSIGLPSTQIGNGTYNSNGTSCQRIGNVMSCI